MDVRYCDAPNIWNHHYDPYSVQYDNYVGGTRKYEYQFWIGARIYQLYFYCHFHGWMCAQNVCAEAPLLSKSLELLRFRRCDSFDNWVDFIRVYQTVLCPADAVPDYSAGSDWSNFAADPRRERDKNFIICAHDVTTGVAKYWITSVSCYIYLFHFRDEPICVREKGRRIRRYVQLLYFCKLVSLPVYDYNISWYVNFYNFFDEICDSFVWQKLRFLIRIGIFDKKIGVLAKIEIFHKNFLIKISIFG